MLGNCFGATEFEDTKAPGGIRVGWIVLGGLALLAASIGVSVTVTFLTQDTLKSQQDNRVTSTLAEVVSVSNLTRLVNTTIVYTQGPQGPPGPVGPAGLKGLTGVGATGAQGIQGEPGDTGVGPAGVQGDAGDKGDQGPPGASIQGPQGVQGATGIAGPVGPAGLKGFNGIQGIQGLQGIQGNKGNAGPLVPCNTTCPTWVTSSWITGSSTVAQDYEIRRNDSATAVLTVERTTGFVGLNTATPQAGLHLVRDTGPYQFLVSNRNESTFGLYIGYSNDTATIHVMENGNPGVLLLNPSNDGRVQVGAPGVNDSKLEVTGSMRVNGTLQTTDAIFTTTVSASQLNVTGTLTTNVLSTNTLDSVGSTTSIHTLVAPNVTVLGALATQAINTQSLQVANGAITVATAVVSSSLSTTGTATIRNTTTQFLSATTVTATTLSASGLSATGTGGNIFASAGVVPLLVFPSTNVASISAGSSYVYTRVGSVVSMYGGFTYVATLGSQDHTVQLQPPFAHQNYLPTGVITCRVGATFCRSVLSISSNMYVLRCTCSGLTGSVTVVYNFAVAYLV